MIAIGWLVFSLKDWLVSCGQPNRMKIVVPLDLAELQMNALSREPRDCP
jgi:hypothetical protein